MKRSRSNASPCSNGMPSGSTCDHASSSEAAALATSWRLRIETVPTLIRLDDGREPDVWSLPLFCDALPPPNYESANTCYIGAFAMLLAERGKLSVADPVCKHLPAFAANGMQVADIDAYVGRVSAGLDDEEAPGPEPGLSGVEREGGVAACAVLPAVVAPAGEDGLADLRQVLGCQDDIVPAHHQKVAQPFAIQSGIDQFLEPGVRIHGSPDDPLAPDETSHEHGHHEIRSVTYHAVLLIGTMLP